MDRLKNPWKILLVCMALIFFYGCSPKTSKDTEIDIYSYDLGTIAGFSELIAADVKRLALSTTLTAEEMDIFINKATKIASEYGVEVFRESDLLVTDLFPADVATDMEVLLLYKGTTKQEYFALKEEKKMHEKSGTYTAEVKEDISRRFGRMLSYSPKKINNLLAENTSFRTMADFGIRASNLFLYYKDLKAAGNFYSNTLGMEEVADYGMAKILRMAEDSYLILVDAKEGMHTATEPKTVALALLTDQLDEWYSYLKEKNVKIKYDYNPKKGGPHDGFVIYDPEGYLLEFERFKQHPENERFVPLLNENKTTAGTNESGSAQGLGIHSTITWLYYKDLLSMQNFVQDVLGLEMVADQGWAKIYKSSKSGFLGLVDEKRGMHSFTEKKAVNVSFLIDRLDAWYDYAKINNCFELRSEKVETGPENKYKAFVGYDPEGYYLEFDKFFPHADNVNLINSLKSLETN